MTRYLAIDPGESTGLAWVNVRPDVARDLKTTVAPNREAVYEFMRRLEPDVVILENFATGQRLNLHSRYTIELCGGVHAVCVMLEAKLVLHTPKHRLPGMDLAEAILISQRGPRGTTRKGAGVWTDHEHDAAAHLCVYLERTVGVKVNFPTTSPSPARNPVPARSRSRPPLRAAETNPERGGLSLSRPESVPTRKAPSKG